MRPVPQDEETEQERQRDVSMVTLLGSGDDQDSNSGSLTAISQKSWKLAGLGVKTPGSPMYLVVY